MFFNWGFSYIWTHRRLACSLFHIISASGTFPSFLHSVVIIHGLGFLNISYYPGLVSLYIAYYPDLVCLYIFNYSGLVSLYISNYPGSVSLYISYCHDLVFLNIWIFYHPGPGSLYPNPSIRSITLVWYPCISPIVWWPCPFSISLVWCPCPSPNTLVW